MCRRRADRLSMSIMQQSVCNGTLFGEQSAFGVCIRRICHGPVNIISMHRLAKSAISSDNNVVSNAQCLRSI